MKKLIYVLLIFSSVVSIGQNKIEGIGKLKLNKTITKDLKSFSEEQGLTIEIEKISTEAAMIETRKDEIVEIVPNYTDKYESPSNAHYCKNARVFFIPNMTVSLIDISDIYLTFYKDTLVDIKCGYSDELVTAFEIKYGKPSYKKLKNVQECYLNYPSKLKFTDETIIEIWINGDLECDAALGSFHDNDCKVYTQKYITFFSNKKSDLVQDCDSKEELRIENDEKKELKKKLKDL